MFSLLRRLFGSEKPSNEIPVLCPHCGQRTVFPSVMDRSITPDMSCKSCRRDLKRDYLTLVIAEQIRLQRSAQWRLLRTAGLTLLATVLIALYVNNRTPGSIWFWVLMVLSVFIVLGAGILIGINQKHLRRIRTLAEKHHLTPEV